MEDLKAIIDLVISFYNTRLTFAPFSFTIFEVDISIAALSIVIFFLHRLFDESS